MKKASEDDLQKLEDLYGFMKVNLTRSDSGTNGEGIWSLPCTKEDFERVNNDSSTGEKFKVYLSNQPVSWGGVNFGEQVTVTTNGGSRPFARLEDNPEAHHDRVNEARVKTEMFNRP